MLPQVRSGKLRGLAVTGARRLPALPDMPTVAESGVPGYEATSWYMLIMPAKTPAAIVAKVHAETVKALKSPEIVSTLAAGGSEPVANSPREGTEFLKAEIARWGKVIRQAKVKIE